MGAVQSTAVNEHALLDLLPRHWLAITAIGFIVWAVESLLEGKTVLEALIGPALVCAWLGAIFLLDRWVQWTTGTARYSPEFHRVVGIGFRSGRIDFGSES